MIERGTAPLLGGAVFSLVAAIFTAPVLATAIEDYLIIENAKVTVDTDEERLRAHLIASDSIPTDGIGGAFGYGILTDDGDAIIVATTHAGVLDSEDQNYILDPVWHNHFVRLGDVGQCGADPGVIDITWQSPGRVSVDDDEASLRGIPTDEFDGTNSISGDSLSTTLGEDISDVVSFKLAPIFNEDGLVAVCVTEITPAEEFDVRIVD